jgi:lipopolysaccharide export LptBFGC system permease protein LptF
VETLWAFRPAFASGLVVSAIFFYMVLTAVPACSATCGQILAFVTDVPGVPLTTVEKIGGGKGLSYVFMIQVETNSLKNG